MSNNGKKDESLSDNDHSQNVNSAEGASNSTQIGTAADSPSKITRTPSMDRLLNDDLVSESGNTSRAVPSSRISIDSLSVRSFDSSAVGGRGGTRTFSFDHNNHSGSMEYSPLGNNSIFEIVMNTRRKNWLGFPSVQDIPPVVLTKDTINPELQKTVAEYVQSIGHECAVFENSNNLKSMNRIEQIKQLENYDDSVQHTNDEHTTVLKEKENLKELEEVPDFYFDKNFQLDNPRIFQKVLRDVDLRLGELSGENQAQRDHAYNELRDRLNDYLDAVESLLVGEISKSSHKFFHALGDVDLIQQKAANTVEELDLLVENANILDKEKIQKKIDRLQKTFKRKNVQKLEQGFLQVKQVLICTEECKKMYEKGEFDCCLSMIKSIDCLIKGDDSYDEEVQNWIRSWPFKLVDLKAVPALTETREFLTNMKIEIGGKFSLQLCSVLLEDVRNYCKSVSTKETLSRLQNSSREKKYLDIEPEFRDKVAGLIRQLHSCEELASALSLYQDKCVAEIKAIIKIYLPQDHQKAEGATSEAKNDDPPKSQGPVSNGSKLSRLIREQTPVEFQTMLVRIFTHASEALRRFYRHQKLLLDLSLNEIISAKEPSENQQSMITQLDIRNGINETIRILQLRTGKIIAVRRELTCNLRFDHFLRLYSVCVLFIQECEALSGEFLTKYLSDVLAAQIKNFIVNQSSRNIRTIQKKIETEPWTPFVVNVAVQRDVNDIVSSMELDPLDWIKYSDLINEENPQQDDNTKDDAQAGHKKSVVVEDNTFVASDSLLTDIELIKDILILSTNLPSAYLSNFEKMCHDLLRYFNIFAVAALNDPTRTSLQSNKNYSIMGESLDCLSHFVHIVQRFYQRLSNFSKDFSPLDQSQYSHLLHQYQTSSEKIYMANAPPPPAPV
ncbi:related to Vacuolar protein sorting-associated protein 54 [Zygosaccharomyces bailii]|nr:related to Vacuolar protein sorting-associated protein 54 [Zygosaccharomyces bailii]